MCWKCRDQDRRLITEVTPDPNCQTGELFLSRKKYK